MKALLCRAYGPPESLVIADLDPPLPGPGEAVVEVEAAGLNFFDTLIIQGKYQHRPAFPFSPGAEIAGRVLWVPDAVSHVRTGDRVAGFLGWGGARETVTLPAARLARIPDGVASETAAALVVTYGTTLHALEDRGRLRPDETLCVLGAAGGTGQAAIELGKLMGARVIACASSPDKVAFCRSLGADETIDYSRDDLKESLRHLTGGRGVDLVYDPVGGPLAEAALRALASEGRYLVVGFASGEIPKLPLNLILLKSCDVLGVYWGRDFEANAERYRQGLERILAWCAAGRINPHIHARFPLGRASEALAAIAHRQVKGKVVVDLRRVS